MPLTHVVHKPVRDVGVKRLPGELVDALAWRTCAQLEDQRFISTIPAGLDPGVSVEGRWFADRTWLRKYGFREERPARATPGSLVAQVDGIKKVEPDATRAAEQLAHKHAIDLGNMTGTGTGGRITIQDVKALID